MRESHNVRDMVIALAAGSLLLVVGCTTQREGPLETKSQSSATEPNTIQSGVETDLAALAGGPDQPIALFLKFVPGRTTTYTSTVEAQRSVEWDGDTANRPDGFQGGRSGHHTEVTFVQQTQGLDDEGNARLKITIEGLKFLARAHDEVTFDFDSAREADQDSPFARMIGLSYEMVMSPRGEVLAVENVDSARQALQGNSPEALTVLKLLDDAMIKLRHEVPGLMALPDEEVTLSQQWSAIKNLNFGTMGTREFERIYTLEEFDPVGTDKVAVIKMEAIPSSTLAQQQHIQQQANPLSQMFDTTESYHGDLQFSLATGEVVAYVEQLDMQWVIADPTVMDTDAEVAHPAVIRMGAAQLNRLKRVE